MFGFFPLSRTARRSVLAVAIFAAVAAPASAKVLATVNGSEITDADLAVAREEVGPSLPQQLDEAARDKSLLNYLIDVRVVTQKAEAEKLGSTPEFAAKLAHLREKLLMETYLAKATKEGVTDAALKATYDEAAKAQKPETEIHARHILVKTEEDAKTALKRIKGGEDFAKVADDVSTDPGAKGGDLGWFTKDRMVPEFADAAFKLEPGQISDPVKSQFGWHIIKVEEKRQKVFPPFDAVKDQVARFVAQKAQAEAVVKLREAAKIVRADQPAEKPADKPAAALAAPAAPKK